MKKTLFLLAICFIAASTMQASKVEITVTTRMANATDLTGAGKIRPLLVEIFEAVPFVPFDTLVIKVNSATFGVNADNGPGLMGAELKNGFRDYFINKNTWDAAPMVLDLSEALLNNFGNNAFDAQNGGNNNNTITAFKEVILPTDGFVNSHAAPATQTGHRTLLGNYNFRGWTNLTKFTIPDYIKTIGEGAFNKSGLTSIVLPSTLTMTAIPNYLFGATPLVSIDIPEGITTIGSQAFANCTALESITFPSTLTATAIGSANVFTAVTTITSMTFKTATPPIAAGVLAFADVTPKSGVTVTVPKGALAAYQAHAAFTNMNVVEVDDTATSIANNSTKIQLSVYPNPVFDRLSISTAMEVQSVKLMDMTGRLVENLPLGSLSYDVSHLSAGFYILKVNDTVTKFLKK